MSAPYNRQDHYYQKAKEEGYRSRAAYKLKELQKKYSILKKGDAVCDLGAWPGGWMQVAAEVVGERGVVIGIDLQKIEDFNNGNSESGNVICITGDVREEEVIDHAIETMQKRDGKSRFDIVLSDMSPKLSGIKEADRMAAVGCAELALWSAGKILKTGGTLIVKMFKCNESEEFIRDSRRYFEKINRVGLESTRKSSNEFYIVCSNFKK